MHFSEEELKAALRREDPGPNFTAKVMAAVANDHQTAAKRTWRSWFAWPQWRLSPVLGGALAIMLAAASWVGYQQYHRRQVEQARKAQQEMVLALRITNAKLNHVFRRVNQQEGSQSQPKVRRQSL